MTFGFLVGSRNFIRFFWVSWEDFVLHGYECIHCIAKSCTITAYRWLFRDLLSSLRTLWSAVIKSRKCSALGTTVPVRLLQEALVVFLFKPISQIGSIGKCVFALCLSEPGSTFARGSIGNSWEELEVSRLPCSGFPQGTVEVLSSTIFSLNSWSQSIRQFMRDISLYFFAFTIFIYVFGFCGLMQRVSPKLFTSTSASFWYWIFSVSVDIKYGILWWRWWRSWCRCS